MSGKYQKLAQLLEEKIRSGEYAPGTFLPSERELGETSGFSRVTVRTGLNLLTQKKIIEAIPGLGYQITGPGVKKHRKTGLVGGVFAGATEVPSSAFYYVPQVLSKECSRILEQEDYHLLYADSEDNMERERQCVTRMLDHGVDGLLVMGTFNNGSFRYSGHPEGNSRFFLDLYRSGIPVVLMDRPLAGHGVPCVCNDDVRGGAMQTEYFIGRGFRRIIFFDVINDRLQELRYQGYCEAMRRYGLTPCHVAPSDFANLPDWQRPQEQHRREVEALLPRLTEDTALICSIFIIFALEERFRTPEYNGPRVEWGGYDIPARNMALPCSPYPYMERPIKEIGIKAAQKMLRMLAGEETAGTEDFLPPALLF